MKFIIRMAIFAAIFVGLFFSVSTKPSYLVGGFREDIRASLHPGYTPSKLPDITEILFEKKEDNMCKNVKQSFVGVATYYSHEGCLGCSMGQIMANGEPFREHALTIAFMRTSLNNKVRVTNLENGRSVEALVADTGGFEDLGVLADLSVGTRNAIAGGDKTKVKIEVLGSC